MTGNHGYNDDQDDFPLDVRVPAPARRKRRRITGLVNGVLSMCVLILFAAGGAYVFIKTSFEQAGPLEVEKAIIVKRGQGGREIAELLAREGAVSNDKIFLIGLMVHKANGKLKAGEYRIQPQASMQQIMDKLVVGKSIQYKITIPEGLTSLQILARIEKQEMLEGKVGKTVPEGSLLPDTYSYIRGTTRQEIVNRMRSAQDKLLAQAWPSRSAKLPFSTPYEALILASIVEKETGVASERPQVASVFVNRLKKRMRLQSDPTIIYGLVGGKGVMDRPILKSDISKPTRYNTYRIDGLPPTPIANPGKAAIEAVLNPAATNYLFFVADGTGGHAFATSLAEHNQNVSRWRRLELQRKQAEPATGQTADTGVQPALQAPAAELQQPTPPVEENAPLIAETTPSGDQDQPPQVATSTPLQTLEPAPLEQPVQAAEVPATEAQTTANVQEYSPILPIKQPTGAVQPEAVAEAPATKASELLPVPKPKPAPISKTAKAILLNVPLPKPKPPVPRQATNNTNSDASSNADSATTATPLPAVPADTQTTTQPAPAVTATPRQAIPNTDLR